MQTPSRLHRAHMDNRPHRPPLSDKQREREERIIFATQTLMASFPGDHFTIGKLAIALRMAPATIRRHFADIESILAEILFRHVLDIAKAMSKIPHDAPNRQALQRAAYMQATRTQWGGFTEPHQLLIGKRNILPDDLATPIEQQRQLIGEALAGEHADTAFTLLDAPHLQAHDIEAMLATHINQAAAAAAGWESAHQAHATAAPQDATAPQAVDPAAKPAQPQAAAQAAFKHHYKDWREARRQKSRIAQAARAGPA